MSRIEIREERRDRYWVIRIDPVFDQENTKRGFQPKVTAYCDQDLSFEDHNYHWKRATISWYSIGECTPEVAAVYAEAIAIATKQAKKMDLEHGFDKVVA